MSPVMLRLGRVACVWVAIVIASACGETRLRRLDSELTLVPLPDDGQSVQQEALDIGELAEFTLGRARFRIENAGPSDVTIGQIALPESLGTRWSVLQAPPNSFPVGRISDANQDLILGVEVIGDTGPFEGVVSLIGEDDSISSGRVLGTRAAGPAGSLQICTDRECIDMGAPCAATTGNRCVTETLSLGAVPPSEPRTLALRVINNQTNCAGSSLSDPCLPACRVNVLEVPRFEVSAANFQVESDATTPVSLDPPKDGCERQTEITFGMHIENQSISGGSGLSANLLIDTDLPEREHILVPVFAMITPRPVAIIAFDSCTGATGCNSASLRNLDTVVLSGTPSFDPREPNNPALVSEYTWRLITSPEGLSSHAERVFDFFTPTMGTLQVDLPRVGTYEVGLTVTNDLGLDSIETVYALRADPNGRVSIELDWDQPNDMDLHVMRVESNPSLCGPSDCFWQTCTAECTGASCLTPSWGDPAPLLGRDDVDGFGPESFSWSDPTPGTYRIAVHYYGFISTDDVPTTNQLRLFVDGNLIESPTRTLRRNQTWRVGSIVWGEQGLVGFLPAPTDQNDVAGNLVDVPICPPEGVNLESGF